MKRSFPSFLGSCALLLLCSFGSLTTRAIETVRVDPANGAPRLVVDGKPVRARFFFGGSGIRPIKLDSIEPQARQFSFDFSPSTDAENTGTMHIRFGEIPGDIYLDDIRMTDLDTGADAIPLCTFDGGSGDFAKDWTFWPTGAHNTVATVQVENGVGRDGSPGLHIKLQAPPDGKWPGFHLFHHANLPLQKDHHYRVSFWAHGEPARKLEIAFYRPGNPYVSLANVFPPQIKLAAKAGVDFVSFPIPQIWLKPGTEPDWSQLDAACQAVLDANPKALLLPRVGCYALDWWLKEHPGEAMAWDKPNPAGTMFAVSSTLYREEAKKNLAALIAHLEGKFGEHMAGYHITGQNTAEWFYYETWSPRLNGYAECDAQAWRAWLKNRYRTDAALRTAWHDPKASLETATVPSPEARRAAPAGALLDPTTEQPVIDFNAFQNTNMADCVCELARVAREATHGRKLVVFFYGYLFEFASVHNGPATSGHYALRKVLDCPDIDVLCSPISYFDRGLGGNAPSMTAAESVALAGKMWLNEDDTATYLSFEGSQPGSPDRVNTLEETNNVLIRNTAQCALRNFATWWMDLPAVGWFNDPGMWAEMARLKALDQPLLDHPTPFRPEVAAVIDPESMMRVAYGGDSVTGHGVSGARQALGRMGCPFGQYLLDDVMAGKVPAKMYVFLTAWRLSPNQRQNLLEATRGATRVWCYAPGYQEGDQTSLEAMRKLTGFRIKKIAKIPAQARPTEVGKKLGLKEAWGINKPIEPLFAVEDATPQETLATYPDGSVAVAMRRTLNGVSLFVGPPQLTPELLRLAADQNKVHLFTRTDCNVYANGPFLLLHAAQDGPLDVNTGKAEPILDVLTGQQVGKGPQWSVTLKKGETRVLKIGEN